MATLYDAEGNEIEVPDEVLAPPEEKGPKGLRTHAKQLEADLKAERDARAAEAAELARYKRRDAFEAAMKDAGIEGVTLEDLGEIPADQINPTALKIKAAEKEDAKRQAIAAQAQALGMTPEQYEAAVKQVAEQKAKEQADLAAAASVAAGGSAPPAAPAKPAEKGIEAWQQAREKGTPQDEAEAEFVRAATEASVGTTSR